jgi:hypothetical protein
MESEDFYNVGFGWVCKRCENHLKTKPVDKQNLPQVWREGEAESKKPFNQALARWADSSRRVLLCPRCGITETIDKT